MVFATRVNFCSRSRLRYRVVPEWWFQIHIGLQWSGGGGGGAAGGGCVYLQNVLCTLRRLLRAAENGVARDVWKFQRFPSRILSSMDKFIFIPQDKHAITSLDKYWL